MKILLVICLIITSLGTTYGQRLQSIRFVHVGPEDKPIGTLSISVGKLVKPEDRPGIDELMGQSVITNIQSFNKMLIIITENRYLTTRPTNQPSIKIIINDNARLYLDTYFVRVFFKSLLLDMKKKNVGEDVVKKLSDLKRRLI